MPAATQLSRLAISATQAQGLPVEDGINRVVGKVDIGLGAVGR